jgi:hypothetical protein
MVTMAFDRSFSAAMCRRDEVRPTGAATGSLWTERLKGLWECQPVAPNLDPNKHKNIPNRPDLDRRRQRQERGKSKYDTDKACCWALILHVTHVCVVFHRCAKA